MIVRILSALVMIMFLVTFSSAFALNELERATMNDPRLENAFGQPVDDNVNVNQQIQISADITNNQEKSQNFVYLVQIKNENDFVVSLGWISGQLTPNQKLNPSLSWTPNDSGEFVAEIFVWEGLVNHSALANYSEINIFVS
ncbi:hypothetical protein NZNM25_01030 [Nitrosopumilus zosterae]|uniref:Uncharacterized protein n=1 Tax=Nitrosopumilus zosterae TaxID=718286 RepID=A0A2S2KNW0_9ARCH|nr:hypothetical protein [Nitrosopumilus zosterae]BDQ31098.1 hypothetical protein NZOSNM25_001208 [Nitrosopumilus zosterae]GBH33312.1 hypothetical protein NZNM25_01030 [Nitrosopumilus zosterae]